MARVVRGGKEGEMLSRFTEKSCELACDWKPSSSLAAQSMITSARYSGPVHD